MMYYMKNDVHIHIEDYVTYIWDTQIIWCSQLCYFLVTPGSRSTVVDFQHSPCRAEIFWGSKRPKSRLQSLRPLHRPRRHAELRDRKVNSTGSVHFWGWICWDYTDYTPMRHVWVVGHLKLVGLQLAWKSLDSFAIPVVKPFNHLESRDFVRWILRHFANLMILLVESSTLIQIVWTYPRSWSLNPRFWSLNVSLFSAAFRALMAPSWLSSFWRRRLLGAIGFS